MTNGEKIQQDFECEVCEPIIEDNIIHVIFADKPHSAIGFDWDWWNSEYKEPTTKNDLGVDCISRDSAIKALDYDIKCFEFKRGVNRHMDDIAKLLNTIYETQANNIKALPSVTPQEPKTGHWISRWYAGHDLHFHVCSECNEEFSCDMETGISIDNYRYCPNCGADMREVKE